MQCDLGFWACLSKARENPFFTYVLGLKCRSKLAGDEDVCFQKTTDP